MSVPLHECFSSKRLPTYAPRQLWAWKGSGTVRNKCNRTDEAGIFQRCSQGKNALGQHHAVVSTVSYHQIDVLRVAVDQLMSVSLACLENNPVRVGFFGAFTERWFRLLVQKVHGGVRKISDLNLEPCKPAKAQRVCNR